MLDLISNVRPDEHHIYSLFVCYSKKVRVAVLDQTRPNLPLMLFPTAAIGPAKNKVWQT